MCLLPPKCRRQGRQRTTLRLPLRGALQQPPHLAITYSDPPCAGKPVSKAISLAKVTPADPTPCLGYYPSNDCRSRAVRDRQPSRASQHQHFDAGQPLCFAGVSEVTISSTVPHRWVNLKKKKSAKRSICTNVLQYSPGPKGKVFSFRSCGVFLPLCAAMRSPSRGFVVKSLGRCHHPVPREGQSWPSWTHSQGRTWIFLKARDTAPQRSWPSPGEVIKHTSPRGISFN